MATSIETLKLMDDGHAIAVLRAEIDALTSTPLEMFLLDWVESLIDDGTGADTDLRDVLDEFEIDGKELRRLVESHPGDMSEFAKILAKLNDANLHEADDVSEVLEFHTKFRAIANDGGDAFTRLNDLIDQVKE